MFENAWPYVWKCLKLFKNVWKCLKANKVNHPNGKGMTPLHLLASKPFAFKSGSDLQWFENIIYHYKHDNPLSGDELSAYIWSSPTLRWD